MAKQKKAKNTKKANNTEEVKMNKAVDLTQKTAKAALTSAVKTVEASENYVQSIYKAGYDANVDALKVAKGYWDATTEIRKDWVKLIAKSGESFIDSTAKMDIPTTKDAMDFGKGIFTNVTETFESFMPKTKATK